MMLFKRLARWGLPLLLLALLLCTMLLFRKASAKSLLPAQLAAELQAWRYEFLSEQAPVSFDLRFRLNVAAADAGRFRLLFGNPDEKAFIIEAGPEGTRSAALDRGIERSVMKQDAVTLAGLNGAELVYEQRRHRWALCADGRLIASGGTPPPAVRGIALGSAGAEINVAEFRFQPVADVHFSDTFMRSPEDPSLWNETSGEWRLNVLRNPLLSANAFQYIAAGSSPEKPPDPKPANGPDAEEANDEVMEPPRTEDISTVSPEPAGPATAEAVTGEWFWSDYDYRVAVWPSARGAVGLIFCRRGPEDYFLFRWSAADSPDACSRVTRYLNGRETVIAESPGGYGPEQWYTLSILLGAGWAKISVDETPLFSLRDPYLTHGQVGLHAEGYGNTLFDDALVEYRQTVVPDFGRLCAGEGLITGGEWLPVAEVAGDAEAWPGGVVARAERTGRLVWGDPLWSDYALSARVGPVSGGAAGLCLYYQDEKNHYLARYHSGDSPSVDLVKVRGGQAEVLGQAPLPADGRPHRLAASAEGGVVALSVDGRETLRVRDETFTRGRPGLFSEATNLGAFADVNCAFLKGEAPISATREVFDAEESMQLWSGAMSDWKTTTPDSDAAGPGATWWHRSDFFGDARIEARLVAPSEADGEVCLVIGAEGEDAATGFQGRVVRAPGDVAGSGVELSLVSPDGSRKTASLDWPSGPLLLGLERIGNEIALLADGRSVLSASDDREIPGRRLGWRAEGIQVRHEDISLYTDALMDYAFNSAPTDWREASGTWEVSNKWTCDPRWSFFSGRSKDGAAVLWNKRPIRGDFTIEFYVGNKMDADQQNPSRYENASDMDITVCADGNNLDTGYSFLLGGFGNTITCAYRERERWAEPEEGRTVLIDKARLHRKWYHVAVSRRGNTFEMRVDDEVVLKKEDPAPLTGGHWAIWTRDNGIMIARVRVCAEEIGRLEPPDPARPRPARTIYSQH